MILVCFGFMSCQNELWDKINELQSQLDNLDGRVARLEELCKEMNTNINALQTIVDVILNNDYIINVTPITKDGVEIGYTITFAQHTPITIYNGTNCNDGADGITPLISVRLDSDGAYYWTLNGEWMLTPEGERIPVTSRDGRPGADGEDGIDGADGVDGLDGQDGITPQLKIENDYWYVSYDEGKTWIQLGKAKGEDGKDGKDGADGENGKDGDSMFESVEQDDTYVYFTLSNGTTLKVRRITGTTDFDQTIIDNLVTSLTLDQTEVWFTELEQTKTIIATTTPFSTSKVYWTSSDPSIVSVEDGVLTSHRTGQVTIKAHAGDKSAQIKTYVAIGDGLLSGEFSISETQKVRFSRGRLQYNPSLGTHRCADGTFKQGTWRFAESQLDTLNYACTDSTYDGWADLFDYGTSGYANYVPWGNTSFDGYLNEKSDWGRYNAIDNGDNLPKKWRCLTNEELIYINDKRKNASKLRAIAKINGLIGAIILPDNCIIPSGIQFDEKAWNEYTYSQWIMLEQVGAVFFPCTPQRALSWGGYSYDVMDWISSYYIPMTVAWLWGNGLICVSNAGVLGGKRSVRLVKDVK